MAVLREKLGSSQDQAVETAKDLKYLRERQTQLGIIEDKLLGFDTLFLPFPPRVFAPCKLGTYTIATSLATRKGKAYVEKWMQEKCHMIRLPDDRDLNALLPELMKYMEQFRGISGSKYLVSISGGSDASEMIMFSRLGLRRREHVKVACWRLKGTSFAWWTSLSCLPTPSRSTRL